MNSHIEQVNNVLRFNRSEFQCKQISWNDVSRFTNGGQLSSMGPNITDAKLVSKNGELLYVIRPENHNEKVSTVSADKIAIIDKNDSDLRPITLKSYLEKNNLHLEDFDDKVSIRFQTTFLPITEDSIEFCPEVYSYNTPDNDNPRNLLLLATTQGLTLDKNTSRYQKLFLQESGRSRWIEARSTGYKVGSEQIETDEEARNAIKNGLAASAVIGIPEMGQRFNALMVIQIPIIQKPTIQRVSSKNYNYIPFGSGKPNKKLMTFTSILGQNEGCCHPEEDLSKKKMLMSVRDYGQSSAARISKGSDAGIVVNVNSKDYKRASQHITITVMLYNTVKDGVPTEQDIMSAVAELDKLYIASSARKLEDVKYMHQEQTHTAKIPVDNLFVNRQSFPT
jgi:hypothetical protein